MKTEIQTQKRMKTTLKRSEKINGAQITRYRGTYKD